MSAFQILTFATQQALDTAANVLSGATMTFTLTGTSTPTNAYADKDLTTPLANPLTADAAGVFVPVFLNPLIIYRVVLKTAAGATLKTWDPANEQLLSQAIIGQYLYPRTPAEDFAGVIPVNYAYPPGDVRRYGAACDGATNDSAAIALAVSTGHEVLFPVGVIIGAVSIRRNDVRLIGCGSSRTTFRHPAGALAVGGVVEVGDTASGNGATAYDKFTIVGMTLDGNRSNTTAPIDDLKGHGMILTKITNWHISDVRAVNCHNAGIIPVINSNYGTIDCYVENCGNATHTGPGFDINSSKFITGTVISKDCYLGARVLDNCWGNVLDITVFNATSHGFIYQNQSANESYANNLNVAVYTAGGHGVILQENIRSSNLRLAVYNATGVGCNIPDGSVTANRPSALNIELVTRASQQQGLLCYGSYNNIIHTSYLDGLSGAQGTYFACDIYGSGNQLTLNLQDSSTWQVRGLKLESGATDNKIVSYEWTNTADPFSDSGTGTTWNRAGKGTDIASGAALTLPIAGDTFHVTGTTNVTSVSASSCNNRRITLIFDGALTFTDGSNLKLNGNFVTTADDTITLWCDGTNWFELCRSAN